MNIKKIAGNSMIFALSGALLLSNMTAVAVESAPNGETEMLMESSEELSQSSLAVSPVLTYDFNENRSGQTIKDSSGSNSGSLYGNAAYVQDDKKGQVLYLDGSNNTYAGFPQGFFDGRDSVTISMDIKPNMVEGNFFTFGIGKNTDQYMFLRTRNTDTRLAMTRYSYQNEQEVKFTTSPMQDKWYNVTLVIAPGSMALYKDGLLEKRNDKVTISMSDLGTNLAAYLGKSFYSPDPYFKGYFDNVKVYDNALTELEVAETQGVKVEQQLKGASADGLTVITREMNKEDKKLTLYASRNNSDIDFENTPLNFELVEGTEVISGLQDTYDLTKEICIQTSLQDVVQDWTIQVVQCNNPVLPGQFADPDIDVFNGKFYLYPTTDGYSGWGGTQFHVFSSEDLVNWTDEGVIVDLAANSDEEAGLNENGIQIAGVPWSTGNAWAPTIEEKNGKYYFYFCGHDRVTNKKAMGVAVADAPEGPFVAEEKPLVTMTDCSKEGISMGQTIDPSIYTEDDGTSYMLFGNGSPAIVELNEDMVSFKPGTMANYSGVNDFREAITVTKRDGIYHFTWSGDDTGSENYRVNYGTSNNLYGPITYRETILSKDPGKDILGTGHHSILKIPDRDEYYMVYHRFVTPLGQYDSGFGYHRETCIDKLEFGEDGYLKKVTPTLEGITEKVLPYEEVTLRYTAGVGGRIQGEGTQILRKGSDASQVTAIAEDGYHFSRWSDGLNTPVRKDLKVTESRTVNAEFTKNANPIPPMEYVTVTYQAATGGKIQGKTVQTIVKGASGEEVTAAAQAGYVFSRWSDGLTSPKRIDKNIIQNKTLTAEFTKTQGKPEEKPQAVKVKLNKAKLTLGVKESFQLKASITPKKESTKVTWSSKKKSVVTVSSKGKITARKIGTGDIVLKTSNGTTAKCRITVKAAPKKISPATAKKTLKKGKTFLMKVKLPAGTASNKITFTSSRKSIASVSSSGKVTGKKKGTAVITAKTYNGKKAKMTITVK